MNHAAGVFFITITSFHDGYLMSGGLWAAAFLSRVESVCSLDFASSQVMKILIRRQLPKLPLLNPKSLERTPKNSPRPTSISPNAVLRLP
jgi:hypothetical protein